MKEKEQALTRGLFLLPPHPTHNRNQVTSYLKLKYLNYGTSLLIWPAWKLDKTTNVPDDYMQ